MKILIILLMLGLQGFSQLLSAQNLTIEVRGIDKIKGRLCVGIYNSAETFMKEPLAGFQVEVKGKVVSIPCKGLPVGTYAIALFQDENGNETLDTGEYGIPLERYGFSNDPEIVMEAPSYEKCSFRFDADMKLVINLK